MLLYYWLVDESVIPLTAYKSGYSYRGAVIELQTIVPISVIYYLDYYRFAYPMTSIPRRPARSLLNFRTCDSFTCRVT